MEWLPPPAWNEGLGFVFGLICVYLTVKENIWCWPTGIANIVFFFIMFFQVKLYAESALQLVFLALSIYGWREWLVGGEKRTELKVTKVPFAEAIITILLSILATAAIAWPMSKYTDASLPWLDAGITAASIAAQILLARKRLENWIIWIAVDIVSIFVYQYKELYLTEILYVIFLGLATRGYFQWRKQISNV